MPGGSRDDIAILLERKPHAGMDLLTSLGRQLHAAQELVRIRANRNPNEIIETEATFAERIADHVARFGGSWTFIISFGVIMVLYTGSISACAAGPGTRTHSSCSICSCRCWPQSRRRSS